MLKVFISWSGEASHEVAVVLRDWLPSVLQTVEPYVSSEDIDKGARWSTDISKELEESLFGILCVVPDNLSAPWLNFEAGALSKSFEKGRVSPFLFGLKRADVPPGPLLQFQSTVYEKDDVFKLVQSINQASDEGPLEMPRLTEALEVWWPHLEERLDPLLEDLPRPQEENGSSTAARPTDDVLDEILELVREQQRLVTDPEALLPPRYLEHVLRGRTKAVEPGPLRAIDQSWSQLVHAVVTSKQPVSEAKIISLLEEVEDPLIYVLRALGRRRPRMTLARLYQTSLIDEDPEESE